MHVKLLLFAAALGWLAGAAVAAPAPVPEATYTLAKCAAEARPADGTPLFMVAAFRPESCPPSAWDDRLGKIAAGGYNVVALAPGKAAIKSEDLETLIAAAERLGLKVVLSTPAEAPNLDAKQWVASVAPVVAKHAGSIAWLQAGSADAAAALSQAAKDAKVGAPVVAASGAEVKSSPDPDRPYREPAVSAALRRAVSEGARGLMWDSPFAGFSPPLVTDSSTASRPDLSPVQMGGLPLSFYESRLFADVVRCLGPGLADAKPVTGAGSDGEGVTVTQRNAGQQGFLFVQAPEKPIHGFHLTFVDPVTSKKVTIPREEGLRLRTFGIDARMLPINLPLPGVKVRYSTAEIYGVYRVGERTVILLADDQGAPNEIALELPGAEVPKVAGSPAEPVWDTKTHTLTLGFVPSFDESFITIGDFLTLGVVQTERAQRTWKVKYQDTSFPLITSAYLGQVVSDEPGRVKVRMLTQQGPVAVSALLPRKPRQVTVGGLAPKSAFTDETGALTFQMRSPFLAALPLRSSPVQVLRRARIDMGGDPAHVACAAPDFDDSKWPEFSLDKDRGAGWYRIPVRLPAVETWTLPWKLSLQVDGEVSVYLNGSLVGKASAQQDKGGFSDLYLPGSLLRPEGEANVLAVYVPEGGSIRKIGITPWTEHAVQEQEVAFYL